MLETTSPTSVKAEILLKMGAMTMKMKGIHTTAQITGKAASMGEGVVIGVLDGLITDFAGKVGAL